MQKRCQPENYAHFGKITGSIWKLESKNKVGFLDLQLLGTSQSCCLARLGSLLLIAARPL